MKKAIVLGGTNDHVELINILKKCGYFIILLDYLDNPPAKIFCDEYIQESILDKEKVLEISIKKSVDLVIATCIDQALVTSSYVSEKLNIPCHISYQTALSLTNKKLMKGLMLENNIPTSNFILVNSDNDFKDAEKLNFPLVIKPVDANSSKGVYKILDKNELGLFYPKSLSFSPTREVIIEEFCSGIELSIDIFVNNGISKVLMITENVKSKINESSFTITESVYNKFLESNLLNYISEIAEKIVKGFKIFNGPLLIQCIYDEKINKISVLEFSSRIGGGSKHFYINQIKRVDILTKFIDVVLNKNVQIHSLYSKINFAKIRYLYTNNGVINEYVNFNKLQDQNIIQKFFIYKEVGSFVDDSSKSTDRCAGIFITADTYEELTFKETQCISQLKVLDSNNINLLKLI